ncbi:ABC transporter substrate-binding protein [Paractinoplanes toevensis]|uniref:ABC transporter substrate-binding protein n=1 Tax=Paractinoplanes toevensis TaxID=571911 RepID=A0A919TDV2_9ACTN|nr:ABC transporter substrate-binding protein [Actinoplanes toevensis]GIM93803.1 ABC transporter substrate-binding protein [Actinoplanes toevensis]
MRTPVGRTLAVVIAATTAVAVAACSPPEKKKDEAAGSAATATSAADLGGLDALIAAAKKEGELNVIALPPTWANYGEIIKAFGDKYGIKVNSAQPDGSSQDEINAANQLKGQDKAPDVFDLGGSVASANTAMFAPYKVATFADVPDALKEAAGTWVNDYGGYMSIGYDSAKVPAPTSVADLLKPAYKGKVALNGDPTQAGAAFGGVQMAAIANGGSADDITKGVEFFGSLKKAGNFLPVDPTAATIESGQTPVVFDWDYLNVAEAAKVKTWKTFVPSGAVLGSYYVQAISKDAPHPAAARLWEEFLYSDDGQNLWLKGGARPVRAEAMQKAGTIDATAFAALPKIEGTPVVPTEAQNTKAKEYLTANWAKTVG